jgi:cell division protein FtsZ
VDEAATRIREEVDQDANIILGATFDEELEGVIRVSVVATGIDKAAVDIAPAPIVLRNTAPAKPVAKPAPIAGAAEIRPQPAPVQRSEVPRDPVAEAIRQAEAQAAADAAAHQAFQPQSKIFQPQQQPVAAHPVAEHPVQHVQQPQPVQRPVEQAVQPAPRMPRVEDFPPVVNAELAARAGRTAAEAEDRGPMGLIRTLTSRLTRREDEQAAPAPTAAEPREPRLRQAAPEPRRQAAPDADVYAPRRGQIDDHGRLVPQQRAAHDDDQLEIPAFLRRQAN